MAPVPITPPPAVAALASHERRALVVGLGALAVILIVGGVLYFSRSKEKTLTPEEEAIRKQIEDLDRLRNANGAPNYTERELKEQAETLDELRRTEIGPDGRVRTVNPQPPTEAEIQKQVNDLDALRAGTQ